MSYITIAEIEEAVTSSRLNGFFPESGDARTAALGSVITRASDTVDGYLSALYVTPVPTSGYIRELCLSVAIWQIHCRRGSAAEVAKKVREAYEDALKDLRDIAVGKLKIGGAIPAVQDKEDGMGIEVSSTESALDSDSLAGF